MLWSDVRFRYIDFKKKPLILNRITRWWSIPNFIQIGQWTWKVRVKLHLRLQINTSSQFSRTSRLPDNFPYKTPIRYFIMKSDKRFSRWQISRICGHRLHIRSILLRKERIKPHWRRPTSSGSLHQYSCHQSLPPRCALSQASQHSLWSRNTHVWPGIWLYSHKRLTIQIMISGKSGSAIKIQYIQSRYN